MTLPIIEFPKFQLALPASNTHINYRPMIQKDEKILLVAKESGDPTDILEAIKQVCQNCILPINVTTNHEGTIINVNDLPIIDLEFYFINLRATSVNNISKVSYKDGEDQEVRNFDIDLSKVIVQLPDSASTLTPSKSIAINADYTVDLQYPPASLYSDKEFLKSEGANALGKLGASCVKNIRELKTGKVTATNTLSQKEVEEFTLSWPVPVYSKLEDWINNLPHLHYEIKYINNENHERIITLSTLNDFFTFA